MKSYFLILHFLAAIAGCQELHAANAKRVALLIGCAGYQADESLRLDTPLNDVAGMAALLSTQLLNFEVFEVHDATKASFESALASFRVASRDADVAMVFFSGHGLELEGENYLITVDATLSEPASVRSETVALKSVVDALKDTNAGVKLAIMDCCRDNPFVEGSPAAKTKSWTATKSTVRSQVLRQLGEAEIPEATLLCFATSAGRKAAAALDESSIRSPFTDFLIEEMRVPGHSLRDIFERVHDRLKKETSGRQVPALQTDNALSEVFRSTVLVSQNARALEKPQETPPKKAVATPELSTVSGMTAQVVPGGEQISRSTTQVSGPNVVRPPSTNNRRVDTSRIPQKGPITRQQSDRIARDFFDN